MDYVGFTNRHLFQRISEHTNSRSSIGKHIKLQHGFQRPAIAEIFTVLKKCGSRLDCLVNEMLLIKELKPSLNVQSDSIRTSKRRLTVIFKWKLFIYWVCRFDPVKFACQRKQKSS